jgi:hypothetical protein
VFQDGKGGSRTVKITSIDWCLGAPIFRASFDDKPATLQVLNQDILG